MLYNANIRVGALVLILLGMLLPLWPLAVLGGLLLVLSGQWVLAIVSGLFLDLLWGQPVGAFSFVILPMTLGMAAMACARLIALRYMRSKMPDRL